ncbi:DUF3592 domain-containing protein [Actinomadura litoris]|uniref:DUF3592 domain-containing protein n=1 Tax=Actinomadura litoris TaxID=2678616 RepID=UPI001FA7A4E8|nr:DUF3592 domain-containing protein [Actinomadura litoris]
MESDDARLLGMALFFGCVGLGIILFSLHEMRELARLSDHGVTTTGTVISKRTEPRGPAGTRTVVKVGFTASDGTRHVVDDEHGGHPVGARIAVVYDPDDPDRARPHDTSSRGRWRFGVVFGVLFLIFTEGMALVILREGRRAGPVGSQGDTAR